VSKDLRLPLAVLAACAALACRAPRSDEDQIRALFEDAARAAGERRVSDVVAPLSERFRGNEGIGRHEAKQLVAAQVLRGEWTAVAISGATVEVEGESARATVDAILTRGAGKGKALADLLPGEASAHRFDCRLEREEGRWQVVAAEWRPLSLAEALAGPPPAPGR